MTHLVLRVSTSLIFVVAGLGHLFNTGHVAGRLDAAPLGWLATSLASAEILVILAGLVMVPAGAALALGLRTREAALVLMAVLVPITLTVQVGSLATLGPLFKNIAIFGALAHLAAIGGGDLSLDRRLGRTP